MRKIALWVALIAIIGGGAYYGLSIYSAKRLKDGLDQALVKLPPDWKITYKSADVAWFSEQVTLRTVEIHGVGANKLDAAIDEVDVVKPVPDFAVTWSNIATNP